MSDAHKNRSHAELVSASIVQQAKAGLVERWTLKQVQGDAVFILCREMVSPAGFEPRRIGLPIRPQGKSWFDGGTAGVVSPAGFEPATY